MESVTARDLAALTIGTILGVRMADHLRALWYRFTGRG